MKNVLVTGAHGFLGKNLCLKLGEMPGVSVQHFGSEDSDDDLRMKVGKADFIFHLAGVNRSPNDVDFFAVNEGLTNRIVVLMEDAGHCVPIVYASSVHAGSDSPYGRSKKAAEDRLTAFGKRTGTNVYVYRLGNLFGKWSRPNYNSVIATFCHRVSHGQDIEISDSAIEVTFVYVDSVVQSFCTLLVDKPEPDGDPIHIDESYTVSLGELASLIRSFKDSRRTNIMPDFSKPFVKYLYSTYLSYLDVGDFAYPVDMKTDNRGHLFELMKSNALGQIFISTTKPGITRGNHYHHTKVEKFCVVKGRAMIRFRSVFCDEVIEYSVSGDNVRVVDIPPGFTHSIENTGNDELVTVFWACEPFDIENPDTIYMEV